MTTLQTKDINNLSNRSFDEKRDYIRMQINANAVITDHNGLQQEGLCINLSGGGALLELEDNLPVDQPVGVAILPPDGQTPMLDIRGHVIRGQAANTPGKYLVAIRYR